MCQRLSLFSMVGHIPRLGWVSVSLQWLGYQASLLAMVEVGTCVWPTKNVCASSNSCSNLTAMCEILYGFIFWRTFVGFCYSLILALLWKAVGTGIPPGHPFLLLLLLAEHYPSICYKDSFVFLCPHKSNTLSNDQLTWWEQNRSKPTMQLLWKISRISRVKTMFLVY
jgi:hypothetical protein